MLDEAIESYQKAVQLNPNFPEAYNNLGLALHRKNMLDEAIESYQKAVQLNPKYSDAYNNLADALSIKGQIKAAVSYYEKALLFNPDCPDIYVNLGNVYLKTGHIEKSIRYFKKAQDMSNPNLPAIFNGLGNAFLSMNQYSEAISYFQKAMEHKPSDLNSYINIGVAQKDQGNFNEAMLWYEKALTLDPNAAEAHWNMASILLLNGNFRDGWDKYEWRWKTKDRCQPNLSQPTWEGSSLQDKVLFVYAEQGVGDEIMFASCLPEIIDQANMCIAECDNRLIPLFERAFPKAIFRNTMGEDNPFPSNLPQIDMRIALGSLPKYLRSDISKFPERTFYLIADSKQTEIWEQRYKELKGLIKIGISWRGGKEIKIQQQRSIGLKHFKALFSINGIEFINLQYGDCAEELKDAVEKLGIKIHDLEGVDPLKDLDGFAAKIAALDLVISVDNSTVHMAGALGVPVWALLPYVCDWRWMLDYEDTPWYESVRLFRQKTPGDWGEVVGAISQRLAEVVKKKSFTRETFVFPVEKSYRTRDG